MPQKPVRLPHTTVRTATRRNPGAAHTRQATKEVATQVTSTVVMKPMRRVAMSTAATVWG